MLMTSSFASRNVLSGVSRSSGESVFGSVIDSVVSLSPWPWLLPALDAQVDLHPLVVLLQDAVILAQGMSLPAVGQEDSLHVRMSVKLDAEHVVDFALQPVRGRPDGDGTRQALAFGNARGYADAFVARK